MSAILQLAEFLGIQSSYHDIWGKEVFATDQTRSALLNAMGFDIKSDKDASDALIQLQLQQWQQALEPVYIIAAEAQSGQIEFSVPSDFTDQKIHWLLSEETGNLHQKQLTFTQLNETASENIAGQNFKKYLLDIPNNLTLGYHMLDLRIGEQRYTSTLIVAPRTCYGPEQSSHNKMWGVAAQLYSLKSERNFGMGDFSDLAKLTQLASEQGASSIGLNPLHPLFPANPAHISPYSPTSRSFLNTLYIDVTAVAEINDNAEIRAQIESADFKQKVAELQQKELIDYVGVANLKRPILEKLYQTFVEQHLSQASARARLFNDFCEEMAEALHNLCIYDALYEHFHTLDNTVYGWKQWPSAYQNPNSAEVHAFAENHKERVTFFKYCQWLADQQLGGVAKLAKQKGMPLGLYLDLAVGCDGSGAEVWAEQDIFVSGAGVGCPPDLLNQLGQDWGLTPINPFALRQKAFKPFVEALRNNMRHAGALRIDHVFGLMRQYWIAPGQDARSGAYVKFPLDDLLRIIALESRRSNCVVIGEDLGTTPAGFGDIASQAKMLSYKVLYFENHADASYIKAADYPEHCMVTVSTHDLPTIKGWWQGNDLKWRTELDLYPSEEMRIKEKDGRVIERRELLKRLEAEGLYCAKDVDVTDSPIMTDELAIAIQSFLASTPGALFMIPLEDLLGLTEQVNIPGTTWQHPNWLRKLPIELDALFNQGYSEKLVAAVKHYR
ncbi:4-alpha-glucanotransferase (malQ-like) protein [Catenovulum agarivorans DS-2]|uniref:4-alpha-glucanotransferase n=1 Tax=Catenovulum agarivorans DS-2 TaxID=1328313 RepID=W7Q6N8_9ALTE|nr:4-alpha-glucanotransferase [Catenovulum agarivorans]EWH08459.1 4-alpha-glucanotransferase (malQ-like) protein [Catenovulum agarivorans DS-2]